MYEMEPELFADKHRIDFSTVRVRPRRKMLEKTLQFRLSFMDVFLHENQIFVNDFGVRYCYARTYGEYEKLCLC